MARAALPGRLTWQLANVVELVDETPDTKSIVLELPDWAGHRAGQHVDIRLTAEDGYEAERSYSIASAPEDKTLVLTVERLADGEVSPYLTDVLRPGDQLELRGPIGGYFIWEESLGGPLLMVAGGSGVVPFRAMLRHWATGARTTPVRLLYSARADTEIIYRDQLQQFTADGADIELTLTRKWPEDWKGRTGRFDRQTVEQLAWPSKERPLSYVCGPTAFVESIAEALVGTGHDPTRIRTERFGPSGK